MLKLPKNLTSLNHLGASDKTIKLSFFPMFMRVFRNWPKEFHNISCSKNIASACFHAASFV